MKKYGFALWSILTMLYFSVQAIAQTAVEVVSTTLPPEQHPQLDQAQAIINNLDAGWAMTIAVVAVELGMRVFKTQNPKSLLYVVANVFRMIAKVAEFIAQAADKVLQRTKE